MLMLGLSYVLWLRPGSYRSLVVFAFSVGTCYGGAVALSPSVLAEFFGIHDLGFVLRMLWTSCGFGTLVGLPLVGAIIIIDHTRSYQTGVAITMFAAIAALAILLPLRSAPGRAGAHRV